MLCALKTHKLLTKRLRSLIVHLPVSFKINFNWAYICIIKLYSVIIF